MSHNIQRPKPASSELELSSQMPLCGCAVVVLLCNRYCDLQGSLTVLSRSPSSLQRCFSSSLTLLARPQSTG